MLFNSLQYAGFLALVVLLYWLLPRPWRRWLLLIASYAFYASWNPWFCLLLAATTLVNFGIGRRLARTRHREKRKLWLTVAVLWGLGILGYFKYVNFAVSSFASLLATFGIEVSPATLAVAIPLGLSFYTFHTLSYVIDVYRGDIEATDDLVTFGVFVAYFPQLLAGPLTRATRMLPQFREPPRTVDRKKWQEGFELILLGLFQKVAVADALTNLTSSAFIDSTTGTLPARNWLLLCLAAVAGLVQFVLDFAGYSNIARGTSKLLGIELPYNFREPLTRSRNLQDYWRRHNMTLFAWFRDYVFRPLRPRATTTVRASLLVVLVFSLSGLWHGATGGWVTWGIFMGVAVVADTQVGRWRDRRRRATGRAASGGARRSVGSRIRSSAYVIAVLSASIVLIRLPSLGAAGAYYREILGFEWVPLDWDQVAIVLYALVGVLLADHHERHLELAEGRPDPPTLARAVWWTFALLAIIVFSGKAAPPFVYFQF